LNIAIPQLTGMSHTVYYWSTGLTWCFAVCLQRGRALKQTMQRAPTVGSQHPASTLAFFAWQY
jgi:hypothetical protein